MVTALCRTAAPYIRVPLARAFATTPPGLALRELRDQISDIRDLATSHIGVSVTAGYTSLPLILMALPDALSASFDSVHVVAALIGSGITTVYFQGARAENATASRLEDELEKLEAQSPAHIRTLDAEYRDKRIDRLFAKRSNISDTQILCSSVPPSIILASCLGFFSEFPAGAWVGGLALVASTYKEYKCDDELKELSREIASLQAQKATEPPLSSYKLF